MSSPNLPPIYSLRPINLPADLPAIMSINMLSFSTDAAHRAVHGASDPQSPDSLAWRRHQMEKSLLSEDARTRAHWVKCVRVVDGEEGNGEDEEMVAYAGWWAPNKAIEKEEKEEEKEKDRLFPAGWNKKLYTRVHQTMKEEGVKLLGEGWKAKYWCEFVLRCFLLFSCFHSPQG